MRTKVSHTPGPWQSLFDADGDHAIFGPDNVLLAVTSGEPNACLIAKAPELLEIAEKFLWFLSSEHRTITSYDEDGIRKIVREAKGE